MKSLLDKGMPWGSDAPSQGSLPRQWENGSCDAVVRRYKELNGPKRVWRW